MRSPNEFISINEPTKRGNTVVRLSKNGNIRIVYCREAIQGKYSIERRLENGIWDRSVEARYSSNFLSEVEKSAKYIDDKPLTFDMWRWLMGIEEEV